MARVSTDRIKFNPQLGRMPTLQFCRPAELRIDPSYQRDVNNGASQSLIRKIAQHWNWDLCQPLVVARRTDFIDRLFVIDGQHRLEAARLRGDIEQLPCVIVNYASAADEAASFVHLNQQRRPLSGLQIFRAAAGNGDRMATQIVAALKEAGLQVSAGSNLMLAPPGNVTNIGGIRAAWARHGAVVAKEALQVAATAFAGERLTYLGTIFPGIVEVCAAEIRERGKFDASRFALFTSMLGRLGQQHWRAAVLAAKAADPDLNYAKAAERAIAAAWDERMGVNVERRAAPVPLPATTKARSVPPATDASGKIWCNQCDYRVTTAEAATCKSPHCSVRQAA